MLEVALEAAKAAEEIIIGYFNQALIPERKKDNSLVTIADTEAESKIRSIIKKNFPDHSIIGEEYGENTNQSDYQWIIDPIDGTTNFYLEVPLFATSIALYKNQEPLLAVINFPAQKKIITSEKDKGTFVNKQKIGVSNQGSLDLSLITYNFSSETVERKKAAEIFSKLVGKTRTSRIFGSCVTQGSLVAMGKVEALISSGASKWDYAAIVIAIIESGGKVTDFFGDPWCINSRSLLASNGRIHEDLLKVINS